MLNLKYFTLMLMLMTTINLFAKEELVVVQTTSRDRRSFVLQKGLKDGFMKGQEIIFSNENSSIVCRAVEVNRDYSLWIPLDKNLTIPFNKQDIIAFNTHAFGNVGVNIGGEVMSLIPEDKFNKEFTHLRNEDNINFRYSYGAALSQTASSVSSTAYSKKKGQDFALEYGFRLSPQYEIGVGGRLDYETYRLTSPELDIPTSRTLFTTSLTYHFINFGEGKNNFYASVTVGYGKSSTTVNNFQNNGPVSLLPQVRFGYLVPVSRTFALIAELSLESLAAHETAEDGTTQNSNQINSKLSVGIRF